MGECIFCKIAKGEIPLGKDKIHENDNFISFLDINPLSEGHCLVIPKKHFKNILDFPSSLGLELSDILKESIFILVKKTKATGFNILQNNFKDAGQIIEHLHFHIIPRKKGDNLKLN